MTFQETNILPGRKAPRPGLQIAAYKASEIAYMTGISQGTLDRWRSEHKGPRAIRVEGVLVRYPASDFWQWWHKQKASK